MTPLQRYIAEEIATDHVDGLLSRREALRRLGLLGMTAAAATALITSCGEKKPTPSAGSGPGTKESTVSLAPNPQAPGMETAVAVTPISWAGPHGELLGSWAPALNPQGAVLVIHENKGLNDWVRSVAGRLGGIGYSALAIDLLSQEGGTSAFSDPAEATAALGKVAPERFVGDLKSGLDELERRLPGQKLAAIGFCFGGGLVWQLLAAGEFRLAAAIPFYGPLPENPDFGGSKSAAVLGLYGALDQRVTSSEPAAKAALDKAGLVNDLVIEPNADHAFFNDSGPRYNAAAAGDAWQRLQEWLSQNLA